jgi:uncharacterized protein YecT (DUF1311 family)
MKFTYIVLFIVSQFFSAGAWAQAECDAFREERLGTKLDTGKTFSLNRCTIHIDPHEGAYFKISYLSEQRAYYVYPLKNSAMTESNFVFDNTHMNLYCPTDTSMKALDIILGGHLYNGVWMGPDNKPWPSEHEIRQIQFSGNNWKGTLIVSKILGPKILAIPADRSFVFCIEDNATSQYLCGRGVIYINDDRELNKIIEAIKAIRFVHISEKVSPSFDCRKSESFVEEIVCADTKLSLLDNALSENYKRMRSAKLSSIDKVRLLIDQQNWIKERESCSNISCIYEAYARRISCVCDYSVISGQRPTCVTVPDVIEAASSESE